MKWRALAGYRRWYRIVLGACGLVLLVVAWLVFSPVPLGGQSSYVIVAGNSMEPAYHQGDLVIVQRQPGYSVGDVVAYFDGQLKRYVIHRIVAQAGTGFTLQGDHNSWSDSYMPGTHEIIGKAWIHLPSLGSWVQRLRNPLDMGLLAALMGFFLVAAIRGTPPRRQAGRVVKPRLARGAGALLGGLVQAKEAIVFVAAALGVASLLLALFAYTRPVTLTVTDNLKYTQQGGFGYWAPVPLGVYDTPTLTSGEPVYPSLTCLVNVDFGYALVAAAPASTQGTYSLTAEVSDPAGWKRTLPLQDETPFVGDHFSAASELNLCQIARLVATKEQITGDKQAAYTVTVAPQVQIQGSLGGRPVSDFFAPALTFQLDQQELRMLQPDPQQDPLSPTKGGVLPGSLTEINTLSILGASVQVPTARRLSAEGLGVSLLGLCLFSLALFYQVHRDRAALVDLKYGQMLVGVNRGELPASSQKVVEVPSIDDLARLADREGYMILHDQADGVHRYLVQDGRNTYRFTLGQEKGQSASADQVTAEKELREALSAGQLQVHYQPIQSLGTGKVEAVEALLRWNHPDRGLLVAADFIAAAERSGLIVPIGRWALEAACSQLQSWKDQGLPPLSLLVNVSAQQLKEGIREAIGQVLMKTGLDPQRLHLEIREQSLLEDPEGLGPKLQELKGLGVHLTLDNFSGKSPLEILGRMPISGLKIDRGTVVKMTADTGEAALARAAIRAAHSMKLDVAAQGVETKEQLGLLRSQKVDLVQGYLLGRPMPADELVGMIHGQADKSLGAKGT